MTIVVGTAGHIDHGKTTLLRALTGIDADRLPQERARGMTIDVGYAHLALDDGSELDFVDVPGHDRLVGNMLVGAGEIDAALLVIAADDGPRAQTREHLELLDALGIADGLVVVTKSDVAAPERVAAVLAEARALIGPTTLADAPIVAVSAVTGDGLASVRDALVRLRDRTMARVAAPTAGDPAGPTGPRLAIDRVFAIRGRGTVVTGTLRGGPVARGALLRVVPGTSDARLRVREVQVHGRTVESAGRGRVALNVVGDAVADLERGVVLTTDAGVVATDRWLVALRPVAPVAPVGPVARSGAGAAGRVRPRPGGLPADRTPVAVHAGTAHASAVLGRTGREAVELGPGEWSGSAILRLDRPVAVAPGDRFVLRRASPAEALAGGLVLDPEPARGVARRRATPDRIRALVQAPARSPEWESARLDLHGALGGAAPTLAPDLSTLVDDALMAAAVARPGIRIAELARLGEGAVRRSVGPIGGRRTGGTSAPGPADPVRRLAGARLDALLAGGRLTRDADRIQPAGARREEADPALAAAMDRLVRLLEPAAPPSLADAARLAGCPPAGIRQLEAAQRIVRLGDDLAWSAATWRDLGRRALALAGQEPLTPSAYRDATGTSRKYVMAILEDLDRRAILRRTDAGHVPGPRAGLLGAASAAEDDAGPASAPVEPGSGRAADADDGPRR